MTRIPLETPVVTTEEYPHIPAGSTGKLVMSVEGFYAVQFDQKVTAKPIPVCLNGAWVPQEIVKVQE